MDRRIASRATVRSELLGVADPPGSGGVGSGGWPRERRLAAGAGRLAGERPFAESERLEGRRPWPMGEGREGHAAELVGLQAPYPGRTLGARESSALDVRPGQLSR